MILQSRPDSSPSFPPKQFAKIYTNELADVCSQCTRAELAVYIALKAHIEDGNPEKGCWPGRPLLSEITGLSLPRISRATTGLERKGFIIKIHDSPHRVDYFITPRTPIAETAPIPPVAPVVAPVDECPEQHPMVSKTAPDGVQNSTTEQTREPTRKDKREPKPEPAPPAPAAETPNGAHSGFVIQIRKAIAEDWTLPDDYRAWATEHRPDLTDRLDGIASNFADYHLSKGTRSANWQAEWRRWIHRERAPKPTQNARSATQTERRYQTPAQEAALQEATLRAMQASEERRIAMLIANGIDPATGLKLPATPVTPPAAPPATTPAAPPEALPAAPETPGPSLPTLPTMPMPTTPDELQRNQQRQWQFAHLVDQGKSLSEIREHLDPPAPAPRPARRLTAEQQAQFIELARSGLTLAEAKKRMGID
jgi:hypothetical protein